MVSITPIAGEDCTHYKQAVVDAISRYPAGFVQANLGEVILVKRIWIQCVPAAGTYHTDRVFLATESATRAFDPQYVQRVFHHEFSSVLLARHPAGIDSAGWRRLTDNGYHRHVPGWSRAYGLMSNEPSAFWASRGFLHEYASFSFEEDFNSIAEVIWCGDGDAWSLIETSDVLSEKARLTVRFYASLDERITSEDFEQIRQR